jgi:hypothetical protein
MTTFRGFIRTTGAISRSIQRENQRTIRETTKRFNEQQKLNTIADGKKAVKEWNDYVEMLKSFHKSCSETINWDEILTISKPTEPKLASKYEDSAKHELSVFKPNIFHKLFGLTKTKTEKLEQEIVKSKQKDISEFNIENITFEQENKDWEELIEIAEGVKSKKNDSYEKAIEYFKPFEEVGQLGKNVHFYFYESYADIDLLVNEVEIIPDYELNQTATGKLTKKSMPKVKFNELYQDYICSCTLRVAREVFAHIPLKYVRVNAISNILDSRTGHLEKKPILSVIIPPETINLMNLKTIDPSDSMNNFVHNMDFKKVSGFNEVKKVDLK